jgi:hypothetical protein
MRPIRIKGPRANSEMGEFAPKPGRKSWRRPMLRKLPIAATAASKGTQSEGLGGTKHADTGNPQS